MKGNDLHSRFSPSVDPVKREEWLKELEALGERVGPENRVVYVSYPSKAACTREAQLSVTKPLTFGNHGAPVAHKLTNLNFADHGRHILGDAHAYYNRMARECVSMCWNFAQYTGLVVDDPSDTIARMTYVNESGELCHCERFTYHPVHDADAIDDLRARYEWLRLNNLTRRIIIWKKEFKKRQHQLAFTKLCNLEDPAHKVTLPLRHAIGNFQITSNLSLPTGSPPLAAVPATSGTADVETSDAGQNGATGMDVDESDDAVVVRTLFAMGDGDGSGVEAAGVEEAVRGLSVDANDNGDDSGMVEEAVRDLMDGSGLSDGMEVDGADEGVPMVMDAHLDQAEDAMRVDHGSGDVQPEQDVEMEVHVSINGWDDGDAWDSSAEQGGERDDDDDDDPIEPESEDEGEGVEAEGAEFEVEAICGSKMEVSI